MDSSTVVSADGTEIGYRRMGSGPVVLVLHGAMQSALSQRDLARALADRFTVVLPDRRGRGSSGPFGPDWSLDREVEDVAALLAGTGARYAVGISSGAIILLTAALTEPVEKLVLFEPPFVVEGSASLDWVAEAEAALARDDVPAALVSGMHGAKMGPALIRALPRKLMERGAAAMMDKTDGDVLSMRELAPTLPYDGRLVEQTADSLERYRAVTVPTLLIGGSKSPKYLRTALSSVERVLPDVRRVELKGVDHGVTENTDRRGAPDRVAAEILKFL
ncbi:MAG TPA: alpha/beta hydrolase [Mycobacteriales bacterium]|nr:alpha/beta hydrolase [Mycobacteriales bacterium]